MSHITLRQNYKSLSDRPNLFPQGAPPTELLFKILQLLFTEEEAALVALLPLTRLSHFRALLSRKRAQTGCNSFVFVVGMPKAAVVQTYPLFGGAIFCHSAGDHVSARPLAPERRQGAPLLQH
jgi:hypothetical protein